MPRGKVMSDHHSLAVNMSLSYGTETQRTKLNKHYMLIGFRALSEAWENGERWFEWFFHPEKARQGTGPFKQGIIEQIGRLIEHFSEYPVESVLEAADTVLDKNANVRQNEAALKQLRLNGNGFPFPFDELLIRITKTISEFIKTHRLSKEDVQHALAVIHNSLDESETVSD